MPRLNLKVVGNHLHRCNNSSPRYERENHYAIFVRFENFLRFLSFILTCCKSPVSLVLIVLNWYYIDNWWKIDASALWMFNGR